MEFYTAQYYCISITLTLCASQSHRASGHGCLVVYNIRINFFEKDELVEEAHNEPTPFETLDLSVDRQLPVNRAKELKIYRWRQERFRKQETPTPGQLNKSFEGIFLSAFVSL